MPAGSTLARLAAATAVSAASLSGVVALAAPASASVPSAAASYLARLNHERAVHGLRPLTMRSDLNSVAQRWSNRMASNNRLMHNPALTSQVPNWQTVGENVGEGPSIPALDTAFWNSPEHRSNVLDTSYRDVGIGTTEANGILWITVDFRKPMSPESSSTVVRPTTTSVTPHVTHRTLRMGMRGADVARVQRKLHVTADGIFGPKTRAAVVRFQRSHHLAATGVVGASTWRALHL